MKISQRMVAILNSLISKNHAKKPELNFKNETNEFSKKRFLEIYLQNCQSVRNQYWLK